jgi:4-hydroxybenzoate polyprenyltransferase
MSLYLAEMYPVVPRLVTAILVSFGFSTILGRIHGLPASALSPYALLGCGSVFALMLILRLMDELKDAEVDRALFPTRPLPSGRVLESDIALSLAVVAALYVPAHAGAGASAWSAAAVLAYAFLMFRWFFVPGVMRPQLPLTLATHTPIIPLLLLHLLVLFAVEHHLRPEQIRWAPSLVAVGLIWALAFAWEISRKIRSRGEEGAYVTYSRLLGARGAVLLAAAAQTLALAAAFQLVVVHRLSPAFAVALAAGWGLALLGHVRFLLHPGPQTSRLRPFAEANLLVALVGGCLA